MVNNKINVNVIDGLQPILDRIIDYDNITNCITEIPQDINLELTDGVLTLKAGSKVYVPNGSGVFNVITIVNDITRTISADDKYMIFVQQNGTATSYRRVSTQIASGTTTPTSSYWAYYNTTDNKIYQIDNGVNSLQLSFPICIVTVSGGAISSIDQVFNGFGYIGLKNYMLPGVKFLIAQGYNLDGTYKNQEYVVDKVIVSNNDINNNAITFFRKYPFNKNLQIYNITANHYLGELSSVPAVGSAFQWYYNTTDRLWYMHEAGATAWVQADYIHLGWCTTNSTHFKDVFKAVDQNDFNKLDEEVVKTSGNQTIGGVKTIDAGSAVSLQIKSNIIDNSVTPETDQFSNFIDMLDKNNIRIGRIFQRKRANGANSIFLQAWSGDTNYILGVNSDGSTEAPTPPTYDNSARIATTAFFRNNMQVVDSKPSSPATGVFYFIRE